MLKHVSSTQRALLGCGSQGFTVLATDTLQGEEVAIKVFRCNDHVTSLSNRAPDYMLVSSIPLGSLSQSSEVAPTD